MLSYQMYMYLLKLCLVMMIHEKPKMCSVSFLFSFGIIVL